jgi:SpoVK/Ycf46/Vps4 family AAA+-type ATPase
LVANALLTQSIAWDDIGGLFDVKTRLLDMLQLPAQYSLLYERAMKGDRPLACLRVYVLS